MPLFRSLSITGNNSSAVSPAQKWPKNDFLRNHLVNPNHNKVEKNNLS